MKRKMAMWLLVMALCLSLFTGGFAVVSAQEQTVQEEAKTYQLYTSETLAAAAGGKVFTQQTPAEAQILCMDADGDGVTSDPGRKVVSNAGNNGVYYSKFTDSAYSFNAGNIGETDSVAMANYLNYGVSELFLEGFPGGVQRGGEWLLADAVDVADYGSISYDIKLYYPGQVTGDTDGESVIYALGTDADGARKVVSKKVSFGANLWSTGVLELDGLQTVTRIAISVLWGSIDQPINGSQIHIARIAVHARPQDAAGQIALNANDMALDFYNGANSIVAFSNSSAARVFHSDGAYAAMGGFDASEYIYGTQRIAVGNYVVLRLKDPVKVSEYKYLDIELLAYPQVADGAWQAETAGTFYFDAVRADAAAAGQDARFELKKQTWTTCRIDLADFADENGYAQTIALVYGGNDSGRDPSEEANYSIQFGIHNASLNNKEIYTVTVKHGISEKEDTVFTLFGGETLGENALAFTQAGYRLAGIYTDEAYQTEFAADTPINANTTLYAKWIAQYTVSYQTNGGETIASEIVDDGTLYTPKTTSRTGYTFAGWFTDEDLTSAFADGTQITADTTLYAKWTINEYTVTFNANGGSAVTEQKVEYNATASEPFDPTKTGYTFAGWYADAELTTAFDFATPVTADTTLYAKWTINEYTVTFNANGGSEVEEQKVEYNAVASEPTDPTKTGYTFAGWYSDEELTTAYDFATPVTANTTLYAKWTINEYTVTFNANGGSEVEEQKVEYNAAASEPSDPTKTGYTFAGWYADAELTAAYDFATPVTADTTLYAKWTEVTVPGGETQTPGDETGGETQTPGAETDGGKGGCSGSIAAGYGAAGLLLAAGAAALACRKKRG